MIHPFISLIKTAITGKYQPIPSIDWAAVYSLAQAHNVNNLIYEAIPYLPEEQKPPQEIYAAFQEKVKHTAVLDMNQKYYVDEAIAAFEENYIPVIMLKGWVMKQLYPRTDLRSMSDTDIFMHTEDEKKVHKLLLGQGYKCIASSEKKDNVYSLEPYVTIEMHKNFFMQQDDWNIFFEQIWERSEPVSGYQYVYRMDKELFYVYMIAHTAKHFKDAGIGVRAFLDLFVYTQYYKDCLDYDRIQSDLKALKLDRFAKKMLALAEMWFGEREPDAEYLEFEEYILNSGVYGNQDGFVMNTEVVRKDPTIGKWRYIWKRAFPNLTSMQTRVPKLKKYPILLPYYWAKRLSFSLIHRRDFIQGEIDSISNLDQEKLNHLQKFYTEWGLL